MKAKYIYNETIGEKQNESVSELPLIQFYNKNIAIYKDKVDIGTKSRSCIPAALTDGTTVLKEKNFREDCVNYFQDSTEYLKETSIQ